MTAGGQKFWVDSRNERRYNKDVEPRRLPQADTTTYRGGRAPTIRELSAATDGSLLLSSIELIICLIQNPSDRYNPKYLLKRNMYHLPWKISRESCTYASIPLPRDDRQPSFLTSTVVVAGFHRNYYIVWREKCQFPRRNAPGGLDDRRGRTVL